MKRLFFVLQFVILGQLLVYSPVFASTDGVKQAEPLHISDVSQPPSPLLVGIGLSISHSYYEQPKAHFNSFVHDFQDEEEEEVDESSNSKKQGDSDFLIHHAFRLTVQQTPLLLTVLSFEHPTLCAKITRTILYQVFRI